MKEIVSKFFLALPLIYLTVSIFIGLSDHLDRTLEEYVVIIGCLIFSVWALTMIFFHKKVKKSRIDKNKKSSAIHRSYGYMNNKKLDFNQVDIFRELPFNGDIYKMMTVPYLNNLEFDYANMLTAVFLKMVNEEQIKLNKDGTIDLIEESKYTHKTEKEIFKSMKGIYPWEFSFSLEDFASWCESRAYLADIFIDAIDDEVYNFKKEGHIYKRRNSEECIKEYVMDDYIYQETKKLFGLKKFLKEFSLIDERKTLEVKLWEQYLMIAALFGMAEEVGADLKKLYSEEIKNTKQESMEDLDEKLNLISLLKPKSTPKEED